MSEQTDTFSGGLLDAYISEDGLFKWDIEMMAPLVDLDILEDASTITVSVELDAFNEPAVWLNVGSKEGDFSGHVFAREHWAPTIGDTGLEKRPYSSDA